jgi:hypothetical protein
MSLTKEFAPTPPSMLATFGERFRWTGRRCDADARPVFEGSNGVTACNCLDH